MTMYVQFQSNNQRCVFRTINAVWHRQSSLPGFAILSVQLTTSQPAFVEGVYCIFDIWVYYILSRVYIFRRVQITKKVQVQITKSTFFTKADICQQYAKNAPPENTCHYQDRKGHLVWTELHSSQFFQQNSRKLYM